LKPPATAFGHLVASLQCQFQGPQRLQLLKSEVITIVLVLPSAILGAGPGHAAAPVSWNVISITCEATKQLGKSGVFPRFVEDHLRPGRALVRLLELRRGHGLRGEA